MEKSIRRTANAVWRQAMAVADGKIIYVGDRAGAERYAAEIHRL